MGYLETHIAVNKNRLREYDGGAVYLKGGSNFQIELFNGKTETYGAEILVNGKSVSNARLVLRPGERVFLDRFIEKNRKFLFETYEADNSREGRRAITHNGDVTVKFYKQKATDWNSCWSVSNLTIQNNSIDFGSSGTTTGITSWDNITWTSGNTGTPTIAPETYVGVAVSDSFMPNEPLKKRSIKTGRVAEGNRSNQTLETVDMEFEEHADYEVKLQILPERTRSAYTSSDIRTYCTACGRKTKKGWKFCAGCGTEI